VIPKWYRLFELQQSLEPFSAIEFTVMAAYSEAYCSEFGKCFVNITDLASQETYKEWLPLTRPAKFKGKPELEVRVQVIVEELSLLTRHMQVCDDLVQDMQKILHIALTQQ
jgi:hypothetical protein